MSRHHHHKNKNQLQIPDNQVATILLEPARVIALSELEALKFDKAEAERKLSELETKNAILQGNADELRQMKSENDEYKKKIEEQNLEIIELRKENQILKNKIKDLESTIACLNEKVLKQDDTINKLFLKIQNQEDDKIYDNFVIACQDLSNRYNLESTLVSPKYDANIKPMLEELRKNRNSSAHYFVDKSKEPGERDTKEEHFAKLEIMNDFIKSSAIPQRLDVDYGNGLIGCIKTYLDKVIASKPSNLGTVTELQKKRYMKKFGY
jgi:chromosome segregation ATPase